MAFFLDSDIRYYSNCNGANRYNIAEQQLTAPNGLIGTACVVLQPDGYEDYSIYARLRPL
jgi:hypothetical protein